MKLILFAVMALGLAGCNKTPDPKVISDIDSKFKTYQSSGIVYEGVWTRWKIVGGSMAIISPDAERKIQ